MGMSARASVVYGIDLGDEEYGESYVEAPEEYLEDGLYEGLDDLFNEYRTLKAGPKPPYSWEPGGDKATWEQWKNSIGPIGHDSYGYEFCGIVLTASGRSASVVYGAEPLTFTPDEPPEGAEALEEFVQFLESKGFKFNPDKRKAQWLLTASYG